jgi:PAT family beta-lactamase induction signal transducer AmpG
MQLLIGAGLAGVALSLPAHDYFRWTLAFLWMLAFSSATHDIAADGFYMLALPAHDQAWFVGIRSTFYRIAVITGQGLLVMFAGALETRTGFPDVVVPVRATESRAARLLFNASAWTPPRHEDPVRIVARENELQVGVRPRSTDEINELVEAARSWNVDHGFYRLEKVGQAGGTKPRWVESLEKAIVRYFGPAQPLSSPQGIAGDAAVALFALTGPVPAGQTVEVVFEYDTGDESFKAIEGSRFSISEKNWSVPFAAIVQVDHRVDEATSATFRIRSGNFFLAWASTFYLAAGIFLTVCVYHAYALPRPAVDRNESANTSNWISDFAASFVTYFQKSHLLATVAFLLLYRFAESQLVKLAPPFLLEMREAGGLAFSTGEVGFVYGTVGIIALLLGGILGGWAAARNGLRFWLPWMALAINLPNLTYVFLSYARPESFLIVNLAVAIEQFGYGFGFAGYMLYMLYAARGKHETAHYAICTGFMALGMMLPGMFSGWLQQLIGYQHFFIWVMIATLPSFLATALVYFHIDPRFGRREVAT